MVKIDLFDQEDLKQIPLYYSNIYKIDKGLVNRIELGLFENSNSVRHRSWAYQRFDCVSPISLVKLDEFKSSD